MKNILKLSPSLFWSLKWFHCTVKFILCACMWVCREELKEVVSSLSTLLGLKDLMSGSLVKVSTNSVNSLALRGFHEYLNTNWCNYPPSCIVNSGLSTFKEGHESVGIKEVSFQSNAAWYRNTGRHAFHCFYFFYFLFYKYECLTCMWICTLYVCGAYRGEELELQLVFSCHVGAGYQTSRFSGRASSQFS